MGKKITLTTSSSSSSATSSSSLRFIILLCSFFFFFFFSVSALFTTSMMIGITSTTCLDEIIRTTPFSGKADLYSQSMGKNDDEDGKMGMAIMGRRLLSGPGSSPPRCTSKCGKCTPCKPVHVPVPPGTPVTAEYYPEAWRCKCGNKLYMP